MGGEGRGGEGEKYEERGRWEWERKEGRQVGEGQDSVLSVGGQGRRLREGGRQGVEGREDHVSNTHRTVISSLIAV